MTPFLRVAWLSTPSGDGPDVAAVRTYVAALDGAPGAGASTAYVLQPKTPVMEDVTSRLAHMDVEAYAELPQCAVLTEIHTLDGALDVEEHVATAAPHGVTVAVSGVYREVATVVGTAPAPASGFGPAIQLGTFNMRTAADELAVSEWYRSRRLPQFAAARGAIRARRWVSVIGGPAKLAILYEFASLDDRATHFEPLETVDHDERRPTAATRTVHPPMSPGVGQRLELS